MIFSSLLMRQKGNGNRNNQRQVQQSIVGGTMAIGSAVTQQFYKT